MNRIIKFRVWDSVEKEWAKWVSIHCNNGVKGTERMKLCQFTGLTDKNGKEIYEGDIVKYYGNYGAEGVDDSFEKIYEVSYCQYGFIPFIEVDDNEDRYEVIGNVFENPELIK